MTAYPVHYSVERPPQFTRFQLVVRILAFMLLGIFGLSLGTAFFAAYLALPVLAAVRLSRGRDPAAYLAEDGPRVLRALRWFAAVFAWFGLVADSLPDREPDETVHVDIEPSGHPAPAAALWRVLLGLPSAFVLSLLGMIGGLVWLWAAVTVLRHERMGEGAFAYLAGLQRWTIRLLAYQASMVAAYPPFSFEEPPPPLPAARTAR